MASLFDPFPPVMARWFTEACGEPKRVQGWPQIAAGSNTLGLDLQAGQPVFQGTP